MSLQLEPSEALTFKRTPTSKEVLTLRNPSNDKVAFKVKTTAPKLYCVSPKAGVVSANGSLDVQVMVQPLKEETPLEQRTKDKFLVMSVQVNDDLKSMELAEYWHHMEDTAENTIKQVKILSRFVVVDSDEEKSSMEGSTSESAAGSAGRLMSEPLSAHEIDTITILRMEVDNCKDELKALRCRLPPNATVGSARAVEMPISLPMVALVVVFSIVIFYLLFKQKGELVG
ncbi:hypothetical protein [Absidia glauca]|uniref:MSP domain-containing protein n=1 Tax=Absidia glauca TaxID=4829 RepID=A0A168SE40_ABSGL|nr:hypothetical protein [Absidia glauca]